MWWEKLYFYWWRRTWGKRWRAELVGRRGGGTPEGGGTGGSPCHCILTPTPVLDLDGFGTQGFWYSCSFGSWAAQCRTAHVLVQYLYSWYYLFKQKSSSSNALRKVPIIFGPAPPVLSRVARDEKIKTVKIHFQKIIFFPKLHLLHSCASGCC